MFYNQPNEEVIKSLKTDANVGLSKDAITRLQAKYGENKLKEKRKKTNLERFAAQFKDVMILILIAAAIVSFVVACVEGNPKEFFEPALILLIKWKHQFFSFSITLTKSGINAYIKRATKPPTKKISGQVRTPSS